MSLNSGGVRDRWWPLSRLHPRSPCTFRSWVGFDARSDGAPDRRDLIIAATKKRDDEPTEPFPLQVAEPRPRRKSWPQALLADIARSATRRISNRADSDAQDC